jgi:hypothetical protein
VLFLIFTSLLMAVVGVTTLAKLFEPMQFSDPFTLYTDIVPGERADSSALQARGFWCLADSLPSPADITVNCASSVQTESIAGINVVIWDGVVQRLDFALHEGELRVGDLALLWGRPEIHKAVRSIMLIWRERRITALSRTDDGHFTYFKPVLQLSFR